MTGKQLLEALSDVDERYIEAAAPDVHPKVVRNAFTPWKRYLVYAACLVFIFTAAWTWPDMMRMGSAGGGMTGAVMDEEAAETMPNHDSDYGYAEETEAPAAPEPEAKPEESVGYDAADTLSVISIQITKLSTQEAKQTSIPEQINRILFALEDCKPVAEEEQYNADYWIEVMFEDGTVREYSILRTDELYDIWNEMEP